MEDIRIGRRKIWRQIYGATPAAEDRLTYRNADRVGLVFGGDGSTFVCLIPDTDFGNNAGLILSSTEQLRCLSVEEYGQMVMESWYCKFNGGGQVRVWEIVLTEE